MVVKGQHHSSESIAKMRGNGNHKGKHHSKETREKLSLAKLGKHQSEEAREKIRLAMIGKRLASKHPMWKGDDVSIGSPLHRWVRKNWPGLKPETCQICSVKKSLDLANITGIYSRDFNNWQFLCRKCHMTSDGRLDSLIKAGSGGRKKW